jgi:hypothetical protein
VEGLYVCGLLADYNSSDLILTKRAKGPTDSTDSTLSSFMTTPEIGLGHFWGEESDVYAQ